MMLVRSIFLLFLSARLVKHGEAFVVVRATPKKIPLVVLGETPTTIRTATTSLEDTNPPDTTTMTTTVDPKLIQLQHEYKLLQENLLQDVVLLHDQDGEDVEKIQEEMMEIAEKATRIHELHQKDVMHEALHDAEQAQAARERLHELREQETAMELDTVHHTNVDVYDQLALYSDFKELAATHKVAAAKTLLGHLQENEKKLHLMLEKVKKEHEEHGHKNQALQEKLHTHHSSFLDNVKGAILAHPDILISLDLHIL